MSATYFGGAYAMEAVTTAEEAEELLLEARTATDEYRFDDAIATLTRIIDSPDLGYEQLALAYGERARARQLLLYVSTATPNAEADQSAILMLQDAVRARTLNPSRSDYVIAEATALSMLGAYEDAIRTLEDAVLLDQPIPTWSWLMLADVHRTSGDYDTSLYYTDLMLHRWTNAWGMPPHYHKARTLYKMGRFEDTIESLNLGLEHQPDYSWALIYRACAQAQLGQFAEAVEGYDAGLTAMEENEAGPRSYEKTERDYAQLTSERDTVEALADGSDATIPELCSPSTYGDQRRERSALLTEEIMAPIQTANIAARTAAAETLAAMVEPEIRSMCAAVPCRERLFANPVTLPDGDVSLLPTEAFPFVDPDGNVLIFPGETIVVTLPIDGETVGPVRLRSATDRSGDVPLDLPPDAEEISSTLSFEFSVGEAGYLLSVENESELMIKYDAFMRFVQGNEIEFAPTSSCTVGPQIVSIEHWPHPVLMLMLTNFRIMPSEGNTMVCN